MSNSIDIRVSGAFEIKVFVFVVIDKVMHIMNIFVRKSQCPLISKVCLLTNNYVRITVRFYGQIRAIVHRNKIIFVIISF